MTAAFLLLTLIVSVALGLSLDRRPPDRIDQDVRHLLRGKRVWRW